MGKKYDVLIKGGVLVRGNGMAKADVAIQGERIEAIEADLPKEEARRVIDAAGKYVMPGAIDVHTHPVYEDDPGGLPLVAAFGGTTTVIHFAYAKPGMKLVDTIQRLKEEALAKSVLDFGIHGALFDARNQIEEIPAAFELGVTSFKMFMTYAKLKWMTDDYDLAAAMDVIAQCGGLAMVHAESGLVTDYLEDRSPKTGEDQTAVFLKTRPDFLEAEAIFRAFSISAVMGCPLYVVHLSTERGARVIQRAREEGWTLYAETCPQYLCLTDADLQKSGPLAKIGPPLRTEEDRLALWKAIQDETIDVLASDHAPKAKKMDDPFFEAPFGSPSAETMLTVAYDEGVNTGRIPPTRLVQIVSENPAKIFGLYPQKGALEVGSDGDLVLFDPHQVWTLRRENQHSGAGYTLYEGRQCLGKPILTMQRGRVIVEDGVVKGKGGEARFLRTKITRVKCYQG